MNDLKTVIVLRPTRGLEFSQSATSVEAALVRALCEFKITQETALQPMYRVHDLPIPDSFNILVRAFMETDYQYAWFVEEDIVVPEDALIAMLALDIDVAAINYNLKVGGPNRNSEIRTADGELHTLGTGCMLIRRNVFETMPDPWFRTDRAPGMRHPGSSTPKPFLDLVENHFEYGGHDGFFTLSAIRAGFAVASVSELRCEHLQLDALGKPGVNNGCHSISTVR